MSEAEIISIAEAVTKAINEAELSEQSTELMHGIEAQDSFADWDDILEEMDVLHVDVVPVDDETTLAARGNTAHRCSVDVAVRKRFTPTDQDPQTGRFKRERTKELIRLLEEIGELFAGKRLEHYEPAAWAATRNTAMYSRKHLRVEHQYTGISRITFVSHKQKPEI